MDIKELNDIQGRRHPWEASRLKAIQKILRPILFEGMNVLDVGCGDGFISRTLFNQIGNRDITAVDINLSDELISELSNLAQGITYQRELPPQGMYDLVLLLDVIEHVQYEKEFLDGLIDKYFHGKGRVMITVPAFQSLYSRHDAYLGHYRRYNLPGLVELTESCGLRTLSSGYLFTSLLLPKIVLYKLYDSGGVEGVGSWRHGKVITSLIEMILNLDNALLIAIGRLGCKIPGLTGWVLCEKREL